MKVSTKLFILVFLMSLLIGTIGIYGVRNLGIVNASLETVYKDRVIPLKQLKLISDMYAIYIVDASHKTRNGNFNWTTGRRAIKKAREIIDKEWQEYMATYLTTEERKLAMEASALMEASNESLEILEAAMEEKDSAALVAYTKNELYAKIDPITEKIGELIDLQLAVAKVEYDNGIVIYSETQRNSYLLIGFGLLLGVGVSLFIIRNINDIVNKLENLVAFVRGTSDQIASAGQEISSSSQQLSEGATEQASFAEEVSSSMEQMVANIQQNTDNAQQTEKIALKVAKDVSEGSSAVNKTVDSMREIAAKISIIGEIARQTNLLALNAAVEAARAGDHGKGFAVVASEVRKLAERSQIAATEINELSSSGVLIAEKSGTLLGQIVPEIQKTARLVQEISASSMEQNSGAEQVNKAIQQLNEIIQQNASASEELAASAEELAKQSNLLMTTVADNKDSNIRSVSHRPAAKKENGHGKVSVKKIATKTKVKSPGVLLHMDESGHDTADAEFEKY
jgi:methyl-accepting chemotaxis protein